MNPDATFRPPGALPVSPLAPYAGPWNVRLAAHLLRRAGFGGSPADVTRLAKLSPGDAVESLVRFPAAPALPASPGLVDDEGMSMQRPADMTADQRKALAQTRRAQELANVEWWLNRMLASPAPLQEKMTLFLHGHFATASGTKGIYGTDIVDQNNLLRGYALGNWRELTHAIVRDRAMLKWLDNARSVKAHPNENMARELMELFTLGIGNYTEQDVRESARAFTGYTFQRRTGQFYFNAAQHDNGPKIFLGQVGDFNGDDVVEIIFKQPACATWFASKLLAFFVYSDAEPELIDAVAALIRKNEFNMAPVMSTLLRSQVFNSERAYRALVNRQFTPRAVATRPGEIPARHRRPYGIEVPTAALNGSTPKRCSPARISRARCSPRRRWRPEKRGFSKSFRRTARSRRKNWSGRSCSVTRARRPRSG